MTIIDLFTKGYSPLHKYPCIPFWVLTPARKVIRWCANKILPNYLSKPWKNLSDKECDVIVSFTTFPARIGNVWQVVECMMRQSCRPKKILLWLSKDQFPARECIPLSLRERENDLFEIRIVEGDIRSHKKYLYALKEFPEDYIFLIDDDIYYSTTLLEETWKAHLTNPQSVICNYGVRVLQGDDGKLLPYRKWPRLYRRTDKDIFFGSGGGTLIHSSLLHSDVTNIDIALKLAPIADDIWLNAMVNLAGTKKILLDSGQLLPICIENDIRLASQNRAKGRNDEQLQNIVNHYLIHKGINPFEENLKHY